MEATDQALEALNEINGQEKPGHLGLGEWIWGALQGDFNQERSVGQIGFDMVVSLIPIVDTLLDARDVVANVKQYRKDPSNKITLFFIATTVVGFVPELGTVVKSVLRIVWVYLKPLVRHADDITNASKLIAAAGRACDEALPKITEYLQHSRVAQWATKGKLPDIYKFVAKIIHEATDKISPATLTRLLNDKLSELKALLHKIRPIVPRTVREHIDDFIRVLDSLGRTMSRAVAQAVDPMRTVLKVVAKRLDDHAWRVEVYRTNRGWIAPISALPRVNSKTGETITDRAGAPDRCVEIIDVTGETVPTKLRSHITDSHIKGPVETGWGATDYTQQEAKRILLTVPAS